LQTSLSLSYSWEYVYKSWVNRYWTQKQKEEFISVFIAIKAVDYASNAFNDSGNEQEKSKAFRNELDILHKKANRWLIESIR